ncbi:MAG: hypothetical protein GY950_00705 [bacterium]|nr:hypothetical protein [bacterium]
MPELIMDEIARSEIPAMLEMALTRAPLSIKRHITIGGREYVVSATSHKNDNVYLQIFPPKPTKPKPKKKGKKNEQKRTGRKAKS